MTEDRIFRLISATLVVSLGTLTFGFNLGYSSPALVDFNTTSSNVHLTTGQQGWFTALLPLGALFGGLIIGWVMDGTGRKTAQLTCALPLVLGAALVASARDYKLLYAGRFISGFGTGMTSLSTPVYIAEISSAKLRGTLGGVAQLALGLGIVLAFSGGLIFHWRWLAIAGAIAPALMSLLMLLLPETPSWLIANHLKHRAARMLIWLRGETADVDKEIAEIEAGMDAHSTFSYKEFLKPHIGKPLLLGSGLLFFQQFCGVNAITFNCGTIVGKAGFKDVKAVSIIVGGMQFLGTFLVVFLVDRVGRRQLLLVGTIMNFVSLVTMGVYFYFDAHPTLPDFPTWLAIVALGIFITGFAIGLGPIPWVVVSEIFPSDARGAAGGIAAMVSWLSSFIIVLTYDPMTKAITQPGVFWFYAGFCFVAFFFVLFLLPETKGKTLEEIETYFT